MKINKFNQLNEKTTEDYYKLLGYDMSILDYLSKAYQLWTDAEELPQISADEHTIKNLTNNQNEFLKKFLELYDIVDELEVEYYSEYFPLKIKANKFNI